jgi:hypothetical protein
MAIPGWAFAECANLTSVAIPEGVTAVGDLAFAGCASLTNVSIPGSVTSIGWLAFASCGGLTSAYFQGNAPSSFDTTALFSTASSFSIYYPSNALGWNTRAWNGYSAQPYDYTPPEPAAITRRPAGSTPRRTQRTTPVTAWQIAMKWRGSPCFVGGQARERIKTINRNDRDNPV